MFYNFFASPYNVVSVTRLLVAISLIISTIQNIVNRIYFYDASILSWRLVKRRRQFKHLRGRLFDVLYGGDGFLALNIIRLLLLPAFVYYPSILPILFAVNVLTFLIHFRSGLVANASDQVNAIILTVLSISSIFSSYSRIDFSIYFLAMLLLISYFTSGILKIFEPGWRNGSYLKQILLNRSYDRGLILRIVNFPGDTFYKVCSMTIVIWQITSVLTPLMPAPLFILYLSIGVCFHLFTGVLMGLTNFIWSFMALLPAEIYLNIIVISHL